MDAKYYESLKSERNVFEVVDADCVVKAYYTFTHEAYLCFVLEYMMGGDFVNILTLFGYLDGNILYTITNFLEKICKIYMGELLLAIEYLHSKGIIHRGKFRYI